MSILLHSFFDGSLATFESEKNWEEEDYKLLFEFEHFEAQKKKKKKKIMK